ncbi:hypothetical protein FQN54_008511 [Arachnomyces sp. PD_36]|nr:hypothetical protein FQN54_008511 [Arachnomyces sp. PD_36]
MPPLRDPDDYELVGRSSFDSADNFDLDENDFESQLPTSKSHLLGHDLPLLGQLRNLLPIRVYRRIWRSSRNVLRRTRRRGSCCGRLSSRRVFVIVRALTVIIVLLAILTTVFSPSYTWLPKHYKKLRRAALTSNKPGRINPRNETVFIAASIYDHGGHLARGDWGHGIIGLIDLIGPENVFLSVYENDVVNEQALFALGELEQRVKSNKSMVFEPHLVTDKLPHITIGKGKKRVKRTAYLAEVRNRALRPLDKMPDTRFDKLLFVNDVVFDPIDAAQLLFSTNVNEDGHAQYRAACSVDFINPFKFYDTFATRDLEGYSMGLPFFPWFSGAGNAESRNDVLAEKDAVRVRSCWGGMVAFDAKYFQKPKPPPQVEDPVEEPRAEDQAQEPRVEEREIDITPPGTGNSVARFRAEEDPYWDASECCLIHADIQSQPTEESRDTGIYMNPFVRVAYHPDTLEWLPTTRRFERLYSIPHGILNHLVGLPWFNRRRAEIPGEVVDEKVWVADPKVGKGGSFQTVKRIASTGGFCGRRGLQVLVPEPKPGQKNWKNLPVPPT